MDAIAGKRKRNESKSNRRRMNLDIGSSSCYRYKRGRQTIGLQNETIEPFETPSTTTLCDLPLEMLDIILQTSYLHWILNSSRGQKDEVVIRSLMSVDICFHRRIARQRFKRAIWCYLKDFYGKTKKRSAIIRTNRKYLLDNIQSDDELIDSLLSNNCITEEQGQTIQRRRSNKDKNAELLYFIKSLDETKFFEFVWCLRQTNQKTVAKIIASGGGVIKMQVQTSGLESKRSIQAQLLHQKIQDLRNRTKVWSPKDEELISRLREKGIEIIDSQLDRQTVVVWIWCHLQTTIKHVQELYETNQLRDVLFEEIQPYVPIVIHIDSNQFEITRPIVECPVSIDFTQGMKIEAHELVYGITKLQNLIYVLYGIIPFHALRVYVKDRNTFRILKDIIVDELGSPKNIGSSENENCLYILDSEKKCVWKMTIEVDGENKIIEWLTIDYDPQSLSVSSDGQLLMVNDKSSSLMIYGSDAELIRSILLTSNIAVRHAVKTSIGNFIILCAYRWKEKEKNGRRGSSGRNMQTNDCVISELTSDGQIVRSFIPSNQTQQLKTSCDLSLDSDDRVFVADTGNERVILLDSDLKWNRILCPTGDEIRAKSLPFRLFYDEEKKGFGYLIVGYNFVEEGVDVFTLTIFN